MYQSVPRYICIYLPGIYLPIPVRPVSSLGFVSLGLVCVLATLLSLVDLVWIHEHGTEMLKRTTSVPYHVPQHHRFCGALSAMRSFCMMFHAGCDLLPHAPDTASHGRRCCHHFLLAVVPSRVQKCSVRQKDTSVERYCTFSTPSGPSRHFLPRPSMYEIWLASRMDPLFLSLPLCSPLAAV